MKTFSDDEKSAILDGLKKRTDELTEHWTFIDPETGQETMPWTDEEFCCFYWSLMFDPNQFCVRLEIPVINLLEAPVEVTGYLSFKKVSAWAKEQEKLTGLPVVDWDAFDNVVESCHLR